MLYLGGMHELTQRIPEQKKALARQKEAYWANHKSTQSKNGSKNPDAVALGKLGGLIGGVHRTIILTSEQRSEIAKKAAKARWDKAQ